MDQLEICLTLRYTPPAQSDGDKDVKAGFPFFHGKLQRHRFEYRFPCRFLSTPKLHVSRPVCSKAWILDADIKIPVLLSNSVVFFMTTEAQHIVRETKKTPNARVAWMKPLKAATLCFKFDVLVRTELILCAGRRWR